VAAILSAAFHAPGLPSYLNGYPAIAGLLNEVRNTRGRRAVHMHGSKVD
jgi:hypothetical protein